MVKLTCLKSMVEWRFLASIFFLVLCSCGHSSSDPCQSAVYDECMRRTEGTWLADATCSEVAVSQCEDD